MISRVEAVWRHLLVSSLDRGERRSSITSLSRELGFPVSTIHQALERPRSIGALKAGFDGIRVVDPKRLQILWAARRDLVPDVVYETRVALPVEDIEARLPISAIPTAYTAYVRLEGRNAVADYEEVVVYGSARELRRRFPATKGRANLKVLDPDPLLPRYGTVAPRCQIYADLFNLPSWQAQRFLQALDAHWLRDVA
jgi:hypothetical protein